MICTQFHFYFDFLEVVIAGENTAIGDGIAHATALLQKKGKATNKVMLLITDGYQNSGQTSIKKSSSTGKKNCTLKFTLSG